MSEQYENGLDVGIAWKGVSKNGNPYTSIVLDGNFVMYENGFCDPEKNHPTHFIKAYPKKKKGDQNQEPVQETVQVDNQPKNNSEGSDQVPF